ncbi:MAG: hypothetical protein IKP47_02505 [Ruminococcus sp.]|nr:hypothetical protein [Ruminococcus sp.]
MKKPYKISLLLGLMAVLLLTACHMSKDTVMLRNERSLKNYAEENCPACTFVRYEKEEYKHTAYFTDDRCGFEFPVSSEVTTVHIDGTEVGYEEKTYVGWEYAYYNYVLDNVKDEADRICKEYSMTYEREKYAPSIVLLRLRSDKPYEELKDGLTKLGDLIRKADVFVKYSEFDMRVEPASEKYGSFYAFYRFKDGKSGERDMWQAYRCLDSAEEQLGVKCFYERTEEMATRDIPGITKLQNYSDKTGGQKKKVYYFTTENGEKKFVADYYAKFKTYYIGDAE